MSRCALGPKKVARLAKLTGLEVVAASVRGNTGHLIHLYLTDGTVAYLDTDGTVTRSEDRHGILLPEGPEVKG